MIRPYTPARAAPADLESLRRFLQMELDKIAAAFARDIEQAGSGQHGTAGEAGLLLYVNRTGSVSLSRVKIGPVDSAGVGYRALRIDN